MEGEGEQETIGLKKKSYIEYTLYTVEPICGREWEEGSEKAPPPPEKKSIARAGDAMTTHPSSLLEPRLDLQLRQLTDTFPSDLHVGVSPERVDLNHVLPCTISCTNQFTFVFRRSTVVQCTPKQQKDYTHCYALYTVQCIMCTVYCVLYSV